MKFKLIFLVLIIFSFTKVNAQCPSNLSFDANNLSFWTFKTGTRTSFDPLLADYGATYTSANTFNPVPANVSTSTYIPSSVINNSYPASNTLNNIYNNGVRIIKAKADNTVTYDSLMSVNTVRLTNVIQQVPTINGYKYPYSVKLGNQHTNNGAEQLVYRFIVPATNPDGSTLTTYNITYAYAVVLDAAGHIPEQQPRFNATVNDLSQPTASQKIECASKQYFVPQAGNDGTWNTISGATFLYKNWQEVSFDVSPYAGKTIEIKFSVFDCSQGGHGGYAYVALRNDGCGKGGVTGATTVCASSAASLTYSTAAVDQASYTWTFPTGWIVSGTSTNSSIVVTPNSNSGNVTVTPSQSCGNIVTRSLNVVSTASAPLTPGAITGTTSVCASSANLTYRVDPVANTTSYNWTIPTGATWVSGINTNEIVINAPSSAATSTISVSAVNYCSASSPSSSSIIINVGTNSVGGTITSSITGTNCPQPTTLTLNGKTGSVLNWDYSENGGVTWVSVNSSSGTSSLTVNPLKSTFYRAIVQSGVCASALSSNVLISIKSLANVVTQPSDIGVCESTSTSFSVVATGDGLTYKWYSSTDGGTNYTQLTNTGVYTGTISDILSLNNTLSSSYNNNKYKVLVKGTCDADGVYSTPALLNVYSGNTITITDDPQSNTICQGSATLLSVNATGPTLGYQWYSNNTNSNVNGTLLTGETRRTYVPVTTVSGLKYYFVKVTSSGSCGTASLTSNYSTLTINPTSTVSATISSTLSTICSGTNKTFTATPLNEGSAPVYAWYKNGVEVTGQVTSSYSTSNLASGDAIYATVTSNKACAIGSPASSNSISTTVNALPAVNNITGLSSFEYGSSIVLANTTASGIWASTAPTIATVISGTVTGLALGNTNISYTVTDSQSPACTNSAIKSITVNSASSTITATGTTSYTYNENPQGPATNTKTGSLGAVTYSYSGTGSTTYSATTTAPINAGTYQVIASLASDANYNSAVSSAYFFTINAASSTITATGTISYTYNGNPQGPATNTKTGSSGAVTYSYSGTGSTTYSATTTAPINAGTYKVSATLASDANFNGAVSPDFAFTINATSSTITVTGANTYTYTGSAQGPSTNNKTGSTGAVTYSYSGTGTTTYSASATAPINAGTYKVSATLASDDNFNGAVSPDYTFTINAASSTITKTSTIIVTGEISYTYNGKAQGPNTSKVVGSTGAVTYNYIGTGSTTYAVSLTAPIGVGTYQVIANVVADSNYNEAISSAYAFTINKGSSTITVTGDTLFNYSGAAQGPATNIKTGSTGAVTYSYAGTISTTYTLSSKAPKLPGTYQVIATLAEDSNYKGAVSIAYGFTINKGSSTITVTGDTLFNYSGAAQGPATNIKTGSTGAVTYSYAGTISTTYISSSKAPKLPGTYQVIATVASDDNYVAATSSAFNFKIIQIIPPPEVVSVKLIIDQQNLPTTLAPLIISNPVGTIPAWCDVNNTNCTIVAPKVPAVIGTHIYLLKSYDTTTLLYSTSFVIDTITIAPSKPKAIDSTFVLGVKSNPSNISSQVSGLAEASFNYYINNTIQNGTPAFSKKAGTFTYSVSQVVNKVESEKAIFKINILDPSSIIQLSQVIDSGILQSNSTFNYTFNLTLSNLSNYPFSNIIITDNLHNSIPITSDFTIVKNITAGSFIPNNAFNSNSDVEVIQKSSTLAPLTKNAASFTMNLSPKGFVGSLSNIAYVKADTKWGTIETESSPASFYVKDLSISIPEGFSPNHDGVHDYFVIIRPSNITIDLKIFNRWGNFVYTNSNYKNEWDGTGTDNFLGQELPEGGYYYNVRAIDEQGKVQVFNGYVILKR